MNDALRLGKKSFTVFVAAATILWTVGFAAFVAPLTATAADYEAGDLIKNETLSTVYYYGSDGQRYIFPNEKTYLSWYADFDGVVTISDEELADITMATTNVVYRAGARWIKIESDAKTYAVSTDGTLHWIETEEVAVALAGDNWNTFIDDVPDTYFTNYTVGASLSDASEGYEGMLLDVDGETYLVWDGELRMVSEAGMTANRFNEDFVLAGTGVDTDAMTAGDDITSELDNVSDTAQLIDVEEYTEATEVTVSLADSSPDSMTLVTGDGTTSTIEGFAHLASFEIENPTNETLTVTNLSLARNGVSSDTTIDNVYLFDGYLRMTDAATVTSGTVSWNDSTGLFTVAAGATGTFAVYADVITNTSGQTIYVSLESADDITFSGSYEAAGDFPLDGATHTIATVTDLASFDVSNTTTPGTSSIDPAEDVKVFENTIEALNDEMYLYSLRLRNVGSINADDIENFRIYIGGVQYGDAVANQDANGYVTFDFSDDPVYLTTGSHILKVVADVVGGSGRTVVMSLRSAGDVIAMDDDYAHAVVPQKDTVSFSNEDAGTLTVNSGTLVLSKATDSPSGNATNGASGFALAKYDVKAYGENMKIENLNFLADITDGGGANDDDVTIRNGAVYVDGVQVGSTAGIIGETNTAVTNYTTYNFGSSVIVEPGETVEVEVRGDIYDSEGANAFSTATSDDITIYMYQGSSNVLLMTTGSYASYPNATNIAANTISVAEGSLTVAKNTSLPNQSLVAPQTAHKIGSFTVASTTTEDMNVNTFSLDVTTTDTDTSSNTTATSFTNLYIEYGPSDDLTTSTVKGSVAATSNDWSIDYPVAAGELIYVNVYADVQDVFTATDTVVSKLTVNATGADSGVSYSGTQITGQTMTSAAGSFSAPVSLGTPVNKVAAANQEVEAANFRLSVLNDSVTLKEVAVKVADDNAASVINEVRLYNGDDLIGSSIFSISEDSTYGGGEVDSQLNDGALIYVEDGVVVEAGGTMTLTVKLLLNDVGINLPSSQDNVTVTLDNILYAWSNGTEANSTTDVTSNELYVYKSVPTFTHVDLTNTTLVNGNSTTLYSFTVSASSNGDVALKQIKFPVSWTDAGTATSVLGMYNWKILQDGVDVSSLVTFYDQGGTTALAGAGAGLVETDTALVVVWNYSTTDSELVIPAGTSTTFTLKATPENFGNESTADAFTMYLAGDSAHMGSNNYYFKHATTKLAGLATAAVGTSAAYTHNIIWTDYSASGHNAVSSTSTADWANGYLLLNLDLDGETWQD